MLVVELDLQLFRQACCGETTAVGLTEIFWSLLGRRLSWLQDDRHSQARGTLPAESWAPAANDATAAADGLTSADSSAAASVSDLRIGPEAVCVAEEATAAG